MPTALLLMSESSGISVNGPKIVAQFTVGGMPIRLTETIIIQWLVILILTVFIIVITRNMKVVPETKRQALAEMIVGFFTDTVNDTMGGKYKSYIPYIGALFCFSLISSLMSLLGLRSPTADICVTGAWALITFFLVQYNRAKTGKVKGYFKSFIEPLPFMLPFNIIGEFANPLALALRHFCNLVGGMVIGSLIYFALGKFAILVPAVASLYFDIFSAVMQAYIFIMLTMSYISSAECGDE